MSLTYILKESLSGFRRTRLSSFVSVSTIMLSLVLFGTFLLLSINAQRLVTELRSRLELDVFLDKTISPEEVKAIQDHFLKIAGVSKVTFISRDQAADIFQKEFGENVFEILDSNPFPPSFKINVYAEFGSLDSLDKIIPQLKKVESVTDIEYNRQYITTIDKNAKILWLISTGVGFIVGLASIFLVSNTIRLTIYAKRFLIQTMKLVGATTTFIRSPFLIEGFLQGVLGGVLADLALFGIFYLIDMNVFPISKYIVINPGFYLTLVGIGSFLGLVGSVISVRKFISMRISE